MPFGTGKAVRDWLSHRRQETYPVRAFLDLRRFFELIPAFYEQPDPLPEKALSSLDAAIQTFLRARGFGQALREIRSNTSSLAAFRKRFFLWFNAFQTMKFLHHARDDHYGPMEVREAATQLSALLPRAQIISAPQSIQDLLILYRELEVCAGERASG